MKSETTKRSKNKNKYDEADRKENKRKGRQAIDPEVVLSMDDAPH